MAISETEPTQQRVSSELEGRVALVTGGTRGIGEAISRRLAAHGATVAAGYSSNHDRAARLQTELTAAGLDISVHAGDVGSADDCRRTVHEVIDRHGRLDILVNNAGITADRTALKMGDDDWHNVLAVNLSGASSNPPSPSSAGSTSSSTTPGDGCRARSWRRANATSRPP